MERVWFKSAASMLAIDATPITKASNTLVPSTQVKVSMRLMPGQNPVAAAKTLGKHLRKNAPWDAHVDIAAR